MNEKIYLPELGMPSNLFTGHMANQLWRHSTLLFTSKLYNNSMARIGMGEPEKTAGEPT